MNEHDDRMKKPNHVRNLAVIFTVGFVIFLGWNALGAFQCMSRDGDIQLSGGSLRCFLDYSNR